MIASAVAVAGGGAVGASARYLLTRRLSGRAGTLLVNVLGSTLLGVTVASAPSRPIVLFAAVGGCGAFTTFSSVVVECRRLLTTGAHRTAVRYATVTAVAATAGAAVGHTAGTLVAGWL